MIRANAIRLVALALALLVLGLAGEGAWAQVPGIPTAGEQAGGGEEKAAEPPPEEPIVGTSLDAAVDPADANNRADDWRKQLENVSSRLHNQDLGESALRELRDRVEGIASRARDLEQRLQPQLQAVQARLQQLGPAPAEGQPPEPEELQQRRKAEEGEQSRTDAALKNTRLIAVQAEQLALDISATRRDRMTERLTAQGPSALNPELWREVAADGARGLAELASLSAETRTYLHGRWVGTPFVALLVVVLLALAGRALLRVVARRYGVHGTEAEDQPVSRKLLRATFITLSIGVLPALVLTALFLILNLYSVLPDRATDVLRGIFVGVGTIIFVFALARAFLAPKTPSWRIVGLSDGGGGVDQLLRHRHRHRARRQRRDAGAEQRARRRRVARHRAAHRHRLRDRAVRRPRAAPPRAGVERRGRGRQRAAHAVRRGADDPVGGARDHLRRAAARLRLAGELPRGAARLRRHGDLAPVAAARHDRRADHRLREARAAPRPRPAGGLRPVLRRRQADRGARQRADPRWR